ncbi:mitochondrial sodium/hydrogen exchanger 9B2-like [Elysia marginata]|uniref:Mitochondrial sodium/hydrogen exchanger 9B2-like n=1 Tax=Elysia marginata TaxID=1093978 RepID=A0AAV4ERR3_9GAST|nr:mitochondrial sodium/hydrogen exchanger 9B2-like [Elysia marginata]
MGSEKEEFEMANGTDEGKEDDSTAPGCCSKLQACFDSVTRPCLATSHPLPPNAPWWRRFLDNFLCPPHSRAGAILFIAIFAVVGWATLLAMTGNAALPGGNLFSLAILFVACWCGGYVVGLMHLPPLLGMLLVGAVLGNVEGVDFARDIYQSWSSGCRQIALTIILIKAGLGLDPQALRRLSFVVLRLAFLPCLVETLVGGITSHLILGFPWPWAFMQGFIIAAVSPAVVVPSLLGLSDRGYGLDKGIPTLVIAAASLDDVLAITGFGVMLGISFSSGNVLWTLAKGPLEAIVGVAVGVAGGFVLWYIPQKSSKHLVLFRSALLLCLGLMCIFGSHKIGWGGAGPLAALTLPFVAATRWRQELAPGEKSPVQDVVGVLWMILQPLLFGLIGAEVKISSLSGGTVGLGIAVLVIGLSFRSVVAYLTVMRTDLNLRERLFVPIAWLPKATVQAAIGAIALDKAKLGGDADLIKLGEEVLMLAVLVILITAPIGAVGIALSGPRLLKHCPKTQTIEVTPDDNKPANGDVEKGDKDDDNEKDELIDKNENV